MGSHTRATGATVKDSNDKPPSRYWHTVCVACGKVTLARPCKVPGDIDPIEHNPVIRCQHCEDTRQYLDKDCFLAPLSAAGSSISLVGRCGCRSDRSRQADTRGIDRITKPESVCALCDLRLDYACGHGRGSEQREGVKGDMSGVDVTVSTKHGPPLTECVETSVPGLALNMDKFEVLARFPLRPAK